MKKIKRITIMLENDGDFHVHLDKECVLTNVSPDSVVETIGDVLFQEDWAKKYEIVPSEIKE